MPDQELEHSPDPGEPDEPLRAAGPAAQPAAESATEPDGELEDADLRAEIELVADLVVAASASDGPLSLVEIDQILGVQPG